jgi:hypothetical protein
MKRIEVSGNKKAGRYVDTLPYDWRLLLILALLFFALYLAVNYLVLIKSGASLFGEGLTSFRYLYEATLV